MELSRVPELKDLSASGVHDWFREMSDRDLLFHPDDAPEDIIRIDSGAKTFNQIECLQLNEIIQRIFSKQGDETYEIAFPVFAERMGIPLND